MSSRACIVALGAWLCAGAMGCYLSHERAGGRSDAAVPFDASRGDAGAIPRTDASVTTPCTHLVVARTLALDTDTPPSSVTPRLVALPGDEVGLVYVATDADPTRIVYERLDASLRRLTGPQTLTARGFTWADPALAGDALLVAFGNAGDRTSTLLRVSFDGRVLDASDVPLLHPSYFEASATGQFWLAFAMGRTNRYVLANVLPDHSIPSSTMLDVGRYGSSFGVVERPDGSGHVIAYAGEGPPGVRDGFLVSYTREGVLGAPLALERNSDRTTTPVMRNGRLLVVRNGDSLRIEEHDVYTLEQRGVYAEPALSSDTVSVGVLEPHLVVAHREPGVLTFEDFGEDLMERTSLRASMPPGTAFGGAHDVVRTGRALVFAIGLAAGPRTFPWLVRVECSD